MNKYIISWHVGAGERCFNLIKATSYKEALRIAEKHWRDQAMFINAFDAQTATKKLCETYYLKWEEDDA